MRALLAVTIAATGFLSISAALARRAEASVGDLTRVECIDDSDSGEQICEKTTAGLGDSRYIAVSPDDRNVYVASAEAIVAFSRNQTSGTLAPIGCVGYPAVPPAPTPACAQSIPASPHGGNLLITPDGTTVFAGLSRFHRDPATGLLTYLGCYAIEEPGNPSCQNITVPAPATYTPYGAPAFQVMALSPDGASLYVRSLLGRTENTLVTPLVTLAVGSAGSLTYVGCLWDDALDSQCTRTQAGQEIDSLQITADSRSVFASSGGSVVNGLGVHHASPAITLLTRDPASGALTPQRCWEGTPFSYDSSIGHVESSSNGCFNSFKTLAGPESGPHLALTANSRSLYASGLNGAEGRLARFDLSASRDLIPQGALQIEAGSSYGLALASDDLSLYGFGGRIDVIYREPTLGSVSRGPTIDVDGPAGSGHAYTYVVSSHDGRSLYANSKNSIVQFIRDTGAVREPPPLPTPPETRIVAGPKARSAKHRARFRFRSIPAGGSFQCKVDDAKFHSCKSPFSFVAKAGPHSFRVRASVGGETDPTPAHRSWRQIKHRRHRRGHRHR